MVALFAERNPRIQDLLMQVQAKIASAGLVTRDKSVRVCKQLVYKLRPKNLLTTLKKVCIFQRFFELVSLVYFEKLFNVIFPHSETTASVSQLQRNESTTPSSYQTISGKHITMNI